MDKFVKSGVEVGFMVLSGNKIQRNVEPNQSKKELNFNNINIAIGPLILGLMFSFISFIAEILYSVQIKRFCTSDGSSVFRA